jgi:hypothetical protein
MEDVIISFMVSYETYVRTIDSMSDKIIWVKLAVVKRSRREMWQVVYVPLN